MKFVHFGIEKQEVNSFTATPSFMQGYLMSYFPNKYSIVTIYLEYPTGVMDTLETDKFNNPAELSAKKLGINIPFA